MKKVQRSSEKFCEPFPCLTRLVTGDHGTGSPIKSIDQIVRRMSKNSENCVFGPSGQFLDISRTFFRHSSDILSTFPFSGLSNDLPVTKQDECLRMSLPNFPCILIGYCHCNWPGACQVISCWLTGLLHAYVPLECLFVFMVALQTHSRVFAGWSHRSKSIQTVSQQSKRRVQKIDGQNHFPPCWLEFRAQENLKK